MIGQIALLIFGGLLFIGAFYLMRSRNNGGASVLAVPAFILSLIGAVGPETLTSFVFEQKGDATKFSFERNVDTPEKIEKVLAVVKETESKTNRNTETNLSETSEALITEAKNTPEAKRSPADYVLLASKSWDAEDWVETIAYAKEGLRLEPQNDEIAAELMNYIGMSLDELESYSAGESWVRKAISKNPNFARAHNSLGVALQNREKYAEAQALYEKSIELDPNYAHAHNNLGTLLNDQKKHVEAQASYEKAIELDSNYAIAHYNLGNSLKDQQKYTEAQASYEKAIELDPNYAHAHNNLGWLHNSLNNFDKAETHYKKAIELAPYYELANKNLKTLLEEKAKQNIAEVSD